MTVPSDAPDDVTPLGCFWGVTRTLAIIVALYVVVGGGLVWAFPHTLILLTIAALLWYLYRTTEGSRFSLRTLLVVTTGIAVIVAIAALVPAPMMGGGSGVESKKITIEVIDEAGASPISNATVALTSRIGREETTKRDVTNQEGIATISCKCGVAVKHSILRTWTTYRTDNWVLEAKAPEFNAATEIMSNVAYEGDVVGAIKFRIALQRKK